MIAPREVAAPAAESHSTNRRKVHQSFGARSASGDPMLDDCLATATALCASIATDNLADLARAGGFSKSWASEMRKHGGWGSFLHKTTVLTYRLGQQSSSRAWAIVSHLKATLKSSIMPCDAAELVQRFWELVELESEAEARENLAMARMGVTRDLDALRHAALAEAAVQEELGAVIQEIQRRRIDPFAMRAEA